MNENYVDFSPRQLLATAMQHKKLIAVCVLVGLAVAGVRLLLGGVGYSSTSQVLVGQPITLQTLTSTTATGVDQARLVDFSKRTIESDDMAATVQKKLKVDEGDYELGVAAASTTNVIGINITASDPEVARDVANGYAQAYLASVRRDNQNRITRATEELNRQLDTVQKQLAELDAQVASSPAPETVGAYVQTQRAGLIAQRAQLEGRLAQTELAGAVDPTGSGKIVQRATKGETSAFGVAAPLVMGGAFGLLIAFGLIALRGRREDVADDHADDMTFDDFDEETQAYDEELHGAHPVHDRAESERTLANAR